MLNVKGIECAVVARPGVPARCGERARHPAVPVTGGVRNSERGLSAGQVHLALGQAPGLRFTVQFVLHGDPAAWPRVPVHAGSQHATATGADLEPAVHRLQFTGLGHAQGDVGRQGEVAECLNRAELQVAHDMNDFWKVRTEPAKRLGGFMN